MYLHELKEIFHEGCASKSLSELKKQVCSRKRSVADGGEKVLDREYVEAMFSALEASIMNKSFLYAAEVLLLYVNNFPTFLENDISFARYIANMENFFENIDHIEFTGSMDLGLLSSLTKPSNSKLLSDVAFISYVIASSYREFLAKIDTDGADLVEAIQQCFAEPVVEILSTLVTRLHEEKYLDEEELNHLVSSGIATLSQVTLLPTMNLLRQVDKTRFAVSASDSIEPEQVELPSEIDILAAENQPMCDVVDVFVADHIRCESLDDQMAFTRLYRESLSKKGIIADKNNLSGLMYEASLVLANNRGLALRLTA